MGRLLGRLMRVAIVMVALGVAGFVLTQRDGSVGPYSSALDVVSVSSAQAEIICPDAWCINADPGSCAFDLGLPTGCEITDRCRTIVC